jgi:hypothetical protein
MQIKMAAPDEVAAPSALAGRAGQEEARGPKPPPVTLIELSGLAFDLLYPAAMDLKVVSGSVLLPPAKL